jgi:peroxiredoxin
VVVERVVPGSPAEKFGLEQGHVITHVAGQSVVAPGDVVRIVAQHSQGDRLPVALEEAGKPRLLSIELAGRPVDSDITRMSFVGQPAPELGILRTVKGSVTPTLQALRGKVVVLEFWASWCTVCRFMVPTLNAWQARFGPEGAVVLGVTVDSVSVASTLASQLGMDYSLASDHEGTATRAYSANAVPTLFIIDQQGTVREVVIGYSEAQLAAAETLIDGLLGGS